MNRWHICRRSWGGRCKDINGDEKDDLLLQCNTDTERIIGIFSVKNQKVITVLWDDIDMTCFYELCDDGILYYQQYYGVYDNERYELYHYDINWNNILVEGLELFCIEDIKELPFSPIAGNLNMATEGTYYWKYSIKNEEEEEYVLLSQEEWKEEFYTLFQRTYDGIFG